MSCNTLYLLSPRLCFFIVLNSELFVNRDDSLATLKESNHENRTTIFMFCTTSVTEGEVGPYN